MRYNLKGRTLTLVSQENAAGERVYGWDDAFGGLGSGFTSEAAAVKAIERAGGVRVSEVAGNAA